MQDRGREHEVKTYEPAPSDWAPHPRKKMLMTPWLAFWGGLFAFAVPTIIAAFFHLMFFHPPVSKETAPLPTAADNYHGRGIYLRNGCFYCHSGYTRPQDVRQGLYYLYPRVSLPGDFVTSDTGPNTWGSARIGPDLEFEAGTHPRDWERAHFSDPRYVTPQSIMPRFNWLSNREVEELITFLERRSGKSGLLRVAGQNYAKRLILASRGIKKRPPIGFKAEKLSEAEAAQRTILSPQKGLPGGTDGVQWRELVELNMIDRSYWLSSNPMPVTTYNMMRGRLLFQDMCIGCHGQGGTGTSKAANYMVPVPYNFVNRTDQASGADQSPGSLYYRILRGVRGTAMENFGTRLRVADIWRVVLFLKTIPNGGLQRYRMATPDLYIQWKPPPALLTYVAKHPISENKDFLESSPPGDPWMQETQRVLFGMNQKDKFRVPGFGELSLTAARNAIKRDYDRMLQEGYRDYKKRGGHPEIPASQINAPPELMNRELR